MELRNYFGSKRRWLVPLLVIPLIAGAITGLVLQQQPPMSTARVTIQAPAAESKSDPQIGLYAAKLEQAYKVQEVSRQIAEQAGIRVSDLRDGLTVNRIDLSDQILLTYTGDGGQPLVLRVAQVAAQAGTAYVATQSGGDTEQTLEAAKQALTAAQEALYAFEDQSGVVDAEAAYAQVNSSLRAVRAELAANQAVGDTARATRAQAQVTALEQQQAELVPVVRQASQLQSAVQAANSQVNAAQSQITAYQARLAEASSGQLLVQSSASTEPKRRAVLEGAVLAAIIAFLAVLGLSLLPDLMRPQDAGGGGWRSAFPRLGTARHTAPGPSSAGLTAAPHVTGPVVATERSS